MTRALEAKVSLVVSDISPLSLFDPDRCLLARLFDKLGKLNNKALPEMRQGLSSAL